MERPVEAGDAVHPRAGIGDRLLAFADGHEESARLEGAGGQVEAAVVLAVRFVEVGVGLVEEEQVLALHVEDERARVRGAGAQEFGMAGEEGLPGGAADGDEVIGEADAGVEEAADEIEVGPVQPEDEDLHRSSSSR